MAERRMFAKTIIDSDAFLDMPMSARLLYYDLGMRADDDGFINSPKKIMRMIGASNDDVNILIARKFVIPFDSGVVVIKHWRINNYLRNDRYTETKYLEEKSTLEVDKNGSYTAKNNTGIPHGIPTVSTGKDRLGKDSIGKYINTISCNENSEVEVLDQKEMWFESFWKIYPKHQDKKKAKQKFLKLCKDEKKYQEIMQGLRNVLPVWAKKDTKYIPMPTTWLNGERWNDEVDLHMEELPF
ncbi:DNA replication protein [Solobacterium sp.]|uniref:DNA replication protein n=1 Tax=Solobacterium sp. TaxID=2060878 RepID=UPI001CB45310|nr:DNA replication protein [Solobacterium sp.]MBF1085727.1 DNA replication protein [Solobacterium sp.]